MKIEEIEEVLNAVKKEIKTTSANARSVPVFKLKFETVFLFIGIYYSIPDIPDNPLKVIPLNDLLGLFCFRLLPKSHQKSKLRI